MSNTPEITTLQKVVEELKTAIQSGDCEQMNVKIQDVLKGAQPVQNLIQVGKVQESDEMISNLKAEIRVATGEILQKCPKGKNTNVKTNNVKMNTNTNTNNTKTNNTKTNNVNMNTNNTKTNNVKMNTNNTKTNNVTMNTNNTNPNNSSQTGGKRSNPVGKRKTRKSKSSRKM